MKLPAVLVLIRNLVKKFGPEFSRRIDGHKIITLFTDFDEGGSNQSLYLAVECVTRIALPLMRDLGHDEDADKIWALRSNPKMMRYQCYHAYTALEFYISGDEQDRLEQGRPLQTREGRTARVLNNASLALMMALDENEIPERIDESRVYAHEVGDYCALAIAEAIELDAERGWKTLEDILVNLPSGTHHGCPKSPRKKSELFGFSVIDGDANGDG